MSGDMVILGCFKRKQFSQHTLNPEHNNRYGFMTCRQLRVRGRADLPHQASRIRRVQALSWRVESLAFPRAGIEA